MPFAALGSVIANNRAAQYAIAVGAIVLGFLIWLSRHDASIRRAQTARADRKARKTITKLEKISDEKSIKVAEARRDAPSVAHSDQLPDDTRSRLFGNS